MTALRISEVAARTGVPSTTLRYYEQAGLLAADRTPSGYRVYDERAVEQLQFISAAKRLQLSLGSIRELLPAWQDESCRTVKELLRPMVSSRLSKAERDMDDLRDLADGLRERLGQLDALPDRDHRCDPSCASFDAEPAVPTPVACSLTGGDHAERVIRWQRLLRAATITPLPLGITASLSLSARVEIVDLVAAEQECCPFLAFRLEFLGDVVALSVTAPDEAALRFVRALVADAHP